MSEITLLIERARGGDNAAFDQLFATLYPDLRHLALARLSRAPIDGELSPTALVHESYLRLLESGRLNFESRAHFLNYAARVMRSIIVDFARDRLAERRGGNALHVTLNTAVGEVLAAEESEIVKIHDALLELAEVDERLVRVVEMRYFAGLSEDEIAQVLGVTDRTVRRYWDKARLMLSVALR